MPKQNSNRKSKKTVVRSTGRSLRKWQLGLITLVVLAIVSGLGTYLYSRQQKDDIHAKAAAYRLDRKRDYLYRVKETDIALCHYWDQGNFMVRAISKTPKAFLKPTDGDYPVIVINAYKSSAKHSNPHYSYSHSWWWWGNDVMMYTDIKIYDTHDWFFVKQQYNYKSIFDRETETKMFNANYIPSCK